MRAILVYNPKSGTAASEDELLREFAGVGWEIERSVRKGDVDDWLRPEHDVVVVAGGDGTIAKVAKRLAGTGRAMAIVPMGTANNVARSLGIGVDPLAAVRGLACAVERRVDLGVVENSHAKDFFLEGFGLGVFAHVIAERAKKKHDKTLRNALGMIADALEEYVPRRVDIEVDGRDLSGTYVLTAVMNARSFGPALGIAPGAKCDDGELDVVLISPASTPTLIAHLRRAAQEGDVALPEFSLTRAKRARVRASGWAHVDDVARRVEGELSIDVVAGAVVVLVPSHAPAKLAPPRAVPSRR